MVIEANLVTNLRAQANPAFPRYAGRHGASSDAAGLKDYNLFLAGQPGIQKHLGDLSGLAGTGGRYQNEAVACFSRLMTERRNDLVMDLPNGKMFRYGHCAKRTKGFEGAPAPEQ